jgi:hypothetical protein
VRRFALIATLAALPVLLALSLALPLALGLTPVRAAHAVQVAHSARVSSCGQGGTVVDDGPASPTAHVRLNRSRGAVGTLIDASGTGWPAGDQVNVRVEYADPGAQGFTDSNGVLVAQAVAPDGTFSAGTFRLPPGPCGDPPAAGSQARVVFQDYMSPQTIVAYAPLAIVAAPQLDVQSSGQVVSGDSLLVSGSGWGAGTTVGVVLGQWRPSATGRPTLVQPLFDMATVQASADNDGGFVTTLPVPAQIRWGTVVQVAASATTALYGDLAIVSPLTVRVLPPQLPAVTLDHLSGGASTPITLTGTHWWPGDTLTIGGCPNVLCGPDSRATITLTSVQVDPRGAFRVDLGPPTRWGTGLVVELAIYPTPYDPSTQDIFLRTVRYTVAAPPPAIPAPSWALPVLRFDLGALLGIVMLIAAGVILAEPLVRRWVARSQPPDVE